VERFRVREFLEAIRRSNADYVIFTVTHATQDLPCPNRTVDAILKGRTSERDLLGEISDGLDKMGKSLILYYNHACNAGEDPEWEKAVGYHAPDKTRFADNLCAIVSELGTRYGAKALGWWFDSSYSIDPLGPHNSITTDLGGFQFPWKAWTQAAKTGFTDRLVTYNAGVMRDYLYTSHQDYWAGEMADLDHPPTGRFATNGLQWHGWTCLDEPNWVWTGKTPPEPDPLYSDETIASFLRKCRVCHAPMCFNVAISQEGIVSATAVETLRRVGMAVE
jgi:hypothetical protein